MPILYLEMIICPECGYLQDATVTFNEGDPWPTYVKECDRCRYIILESEWQVYRATHLQDHTPHATELMREVKEAITQLDEPNNLTYSQQRRRR